MRSFLKQNCALIIIVLCILWIFSEVRYWRLQHRVSELRITQVQIRAVDKISNAQIPATVGGSWSSSPRDDIPVVVLGSSVDGIQRFTIASDSKPFQIVVSSDGYQEQSVTVSNSTTGELTVKLEKK
jgi:hypothetical protein